jgi:hypothetical protein
MGVVRLLQGRFGPALHDSSVTPAPRSWWATVVDRRHSSSEVGGTYCSRRHHRGGHPHRCRTGQEAGHPWPSGPGVSRSHNALPTTHRRHGRPIGDGSADADGSG